MSSWRLRCRTCAIERDPGSLVYRCAACGGELVVDYTRVEPVDERRAGMWRRAGQLPLAAREHIVSLGEGGTPCVRLSAALTQRLGVGAAWLKCEHLNPTGSFKDRIASVALSLALERGLSGCVGTSSGNGGAAAAAYAARAKLPALLFALADTAPEKLLQLRALGATVYLVEGLGHDAATTLETAGTIADLAAGYGLFPMLTGGRYSPEAMEGATTISAELVEQAPEATTIYVPIGGGGLCSAVWRGYQRCGRSPRIVAVQPTGCPTLRDALQGDLSGLKSPCTTTISGLQVAALFDGPGAVEAVQRSRGHLVEVGDDAIYAAQSDLASDGLLVEPAGATALAGALEDSRSRRLGADDALVIVATGAGYKDRAALERIVGTAPAPSIQVRGIREAIEQAIAEKNPRESSA